MSTNDTSTMLVPIEDYAYARLSSLARIKGVTVHELAIGRLGPLLLTSFSAVGRHCGLATRVVGLATSHGRLRVLTDQTLLPMAPRPSVMAALVLQACRHDLDPSWLASALLTISVESPRSFPPATTSEVAA